MKVKVKDLLIPLSSNSKYTEEYSYNNYGEYVVIDGSTQNFDFKLKIDTFDYDCTVISVSTVGYYAGHVKSYKGKFSVGNNVACFKMSDICISKNLEVEYLVYKLFNISKEIISGDSGGYAALNITKFLDAELFIDNKSTQNSIASFIKNRDSLFKIENQLQKACDIFSLNQLENNSGNCVPINEVVDLIGGSSYLTEEFIYNNSDNLDNLVPVYTGATSFNDCYVNKAVVKKLFSNAIKVTRKGIAGSLMYIKNDFTINDDAYVVKINKDYLDKVDIYFLYFYMQTIISGAISSMSGNGTFSKTKFLTYDICLPKIDVQRSIGELYKKYLSLYNLVNKLKEYRIYLNQNLSNIII